MHFLFLFSAGWSGPILIERPTGDDPVLMPKNVTASNLHRSKSMSCATRVVIRPDPSFTKFDPHDEDESSHSDEDNDEDGGIVIKTQRARATSIASPASAVPTSLTTPVTKNGLSNGKSPSRPPPAYTPRSAEAKRSSRSQSSLRFGSLSNLCPVNETPLTARSVSSSSNSSSLHSLRPQLRPPSFGAIPEEDACLTTTTNSMMMMTKTRRKLSYQNSHYYTTQQQQQQHQLRPQNVHPLRRHSYSLHAQPQPLSIQEFGYGLPATNQASASAASMTTSPKKGFLRRKVNQPSMVAGRQPQPEQERRSAIMVQRKFSTPPYVDALMLNSHPNYYYQQHASSSTSYHRQVTLT